MKKPNVQLLYLTSSMTSARIKKQTNVFDGFLRRVSGARREKGCVFNSF